MDLSVILDGAWRDPQMRAQVNHVATQMHSASVELLCTAAIDMAADRIRTRQPGNSDATPEIATTLAAQHNGWDTARRMDTSRPLEHSLREAYEVGSVITHGLNSEPCLALTPSTSASSPVTFVTN